MAEKKEKSESGDNHENTTYQWYRNNQIMEGETNSNLVLTIDENSGEGKYYCRLNNTDFPELELRRNIVLIEVEITTSTKNIDEMDFQIFPNPVGSSLNLISKSDFLDSMYLITDMNGSKISQGKLNQEIYLEELPRGMYVLTISKKGGNIARNLLRCNFSNPHLFRLCKLQTRLRKNLQVLLRT